MAILEQSIFADIDGGCWLCEYKEMDEWMIASGYSWVRREHFRSVEEAMQKYPDVDVRVGTPPGLEPGGFSKFLKKRR